MEIGKSTDEDVHSTKGIIDNIPKKQRFGHEDRKGMVDMEDVNLKESGLRDQTSRHERNGRGQRDQRKSSRKRNDAMCGKDMERIYWQISSDRRIYWSKWVWNHRCLSRWATYSNIIYGRDRENLICIQWRYLDGERSTPTAGV